MSKLEMLCKKDAPNRTDGKITPRTRKYRLSLGVFETESRRVLPSAYYASLVANVHIDM